MPSLKALGTTLLFVGVLVHVRAGDPAPLSLEPGEWLGIDGNWSSVKIRVGEPLQTLNVLVSTSLSELWVPGSTGCLDGETRCIEDRGGVFTIASSAGWSPLGRWDLGLPYLLSPANGDYGLDRLTVRNPFADSSFSFPDVLIAALNTTNYFTGFFGLNIISSSLGASVVSSPLTQAVTPAGLIPSYSYGYTAGAHYKNMPASVTLGGFDSSRLEPQETEFMLSTSELKPYVLVRAIEATVVGGREIPGSWESGSTVLASMNQSFEALFDSTTPFLWLPDAVCDSFAAALGLEYNNSLDLYLLGNSQYADMKDPRYRFVFSLSAIDNTDDFGDPLNVPGVVNITISSRALASTLKYPYKQPAIPFGSPAVPYFPLRRLKNGTVPVIGRSFMQEAYMIAEFDRRVFSIHPAVFPDHPFSSAASIVPINQPADGSLPGPPDPSRKGMALAAVIGIVVGVVTTCVVSLALWACCRRRKAGEAKTVSPAESKVSLSVAEPETTARTTRTARTARAPVARILSRLGIRTKSRPRDMLPSELPDNEKTTAGTGQDRLHETPISQEVYEMPVPMSPVELDAQTPPRANDTEAGGGGPSLSPPPPAPYQAAVRRPMERRVVSGLSAYSYSDSAPPSASGGGSGWPYLEPPAAQELNPLMAWRLSDQSLAPSPSFAPSESARSSLPSPLSPEADWQNRFPEEAPAPAQSVTFPTPIYPGPPQHPARRHPRHGPAAIDTRSVSPAVSSQHPSPSSATVATTPPFFQLTPIEEASRVVCLGSIPDNVRLPHGRAMPEAPAPSGPNPLSTQQQQQQHIISSSNGRVSIDTLGSNFTDDEELGYSPAHPWPSMGQQQPPPSLPERFRPAGSSSAGPVVAGGGGDVSPGSAERIDTGLELVHVPQLADRRYSWEVGEAGEMGEADR